MITNCPHCGEVIQIGLLECDNLGWHTACDKCSGSFDFNFSEEDIKMIEFTHTNKTGHTSNRCIGLDNFRGCWFNYRENLPELTDNISAVKIDGVEIPVNTFGGLIGILSESGKLDADYKYDTETPLTREEVIRYCLEEGTGIEYDKSGQRYVNEYTINWFLNHHRPHQAREAVRREICLLDFDEWMAIENILYGVNSEDLPYETAQKINNILWEDLDETPLELDNTEE